MSGWNSLQSVSSFHSLLQTAGCLIALFVIAAGLTASYYWSRRSDLVIAFERARNRYLPHWRFDIETTLHNTFVEIAILGTAALLALSYASFSYGQRKAELVVASNEAQTAKVRAEADALDQQAAALRGQVDALQRANVQLHNANTQTTTSHSAEIAELQQKLRYAESRRVASVESLRWEVKQAETRAETTIARLERQLSQVERRLTALTVQRRLTANERDLLIETLRPFAGQKVSIAGIEGTDDDKVYATDFVEVFEAAGWEHPDVAYRRWDRDPVGVEITLSEADGRAGRVNSAIGALINVVRKLGLTDGNTVYMNSDIPTGEVEVKIGRKLMR